MEQEAREEDSLIKALESVLSAMVGTFHHTDALWYRNCGRGGKDVKKTVVADLLGISQSLHITRAMRNKIMVRLRKKWVKYS